MAEFTIEKEAKVKIDKAKPESTVPQSKYISTSHSRSDARSHHSEASSDADLFAAMKIGLASKPKPTKKKETGLFTSVLSSIAEDPELVREYTAKGSTIDADLVMKVSSKVSNGVKNAIKEIKKAQQVSILFLLDTTGSMSSYINGVKDQINHIVKGVEDSGCQIEGLAFIGYKDHSDGVNHFETLEFTKKIASFKSFLKNITATGGGDTPEDVLGGLKKALDITWPKHSGTRIIFHLCDAPPHGKGTYHNVDDSYPNGHPSDPSVSELFSTMKNKSIMYYFGQINNSTDLMIQKFELQYGSIDKFNIESNITKIAESVTASVMKSVGIMSAIGSAKGTHERRREYTITHDEPDWSRIPITKCTIVALRLPETIDEIKRFEKFDQVVHECDIQIAPHPFANGSVRIAYYGKIHYTDFKSGSITVDDVVFKEIIHKAALSNLDRMRYMIDLEVQTVASKFAFEFNSRLERTTVNPGIRLKFLVAKVIRIPSAGGQFRFMAEEKRFRGKVEMIKYTNNHHFVRTEMTADENSQTRVELAVCFSHFSHKHSDGYLMITDLQGTDTTDSKLRPTLLLTDPAIHCPGVLRFGKTNLQQEGIDGFYSTHKCNRFCHALGLSR